MNWLAKNISGARKIKGLTQEELATQAKINLRTVQRIENGESEPRGKTLSLICDVLEMNPKELELAHKSSYLDKVGLVVLNGFFLISVNLILMGIIGFLTVDSNSNLNSVVGGYLTSLFIPFFIVAVTKRMNGIERLLKFGSGYIPRVD